MLQPTVIAQGDLSRMRELRELLIDEGIPAELTRPPRRGG